MEQFACDLEESVLRFPSAPMNAFQRFHHEPRMAGMHTYRVLRRRDDGGPVKRIFLMHNGLNEMDSLSLYYQLASQLVQRHPGTVCILRPLPGHLTRSPFQAFAETPLDTYLWDGSNLFQHFLSYMLETRWFLTGPTNVDPSAWRVWEVTAVGASRR
jgi:hypothetical protein